MELFTLELRPRLRSLSAYISFDIDTDTSAIKVKLLEDVIVIQMKDKTYNFPLPNVKLLPSSLSSLRVTNRWICFRIQTQPKPIYGKFETEVLENEDKSSGDVISKLDRIDLPPKNTDCKLFCVCCKNEITKTLNFQRVLPLPSSDCDPQEWFCHKHGEEESFSLDPKESDLFYSVNYFVLNKNVVQNNLMLQDSLIYCNICLSILGSPHGNQSKSMKFWSCCVEHQISNNKSVMKAITTFTDFLLTIKHIAEFTLGEKILLEAQDKTSFHHILIRPMEAKLNVLTENRTSANNQTIILTAEKSNSDDQTIKLKSSSVVKVLYKFDVTNETTRYDDPDVKYCEVALPCILAGLDKLISSSMRFPPVYRNAEGFFIGYLPL